MEPKKMQEDRVQGDLFRSRLDQLISHEHPLYKLSGEIPHPNNSTRVVFIK